MSEIYFEEKIKENFATSSSELINGNFKYFFENCKIYQKDKDYKSNYKNKSKSFSYKSKDDQIKKNKKIDEDYFNEIYSVDTRDSKTFNLYEIKCYNSIKENIEFSLIDKSDIKNQNYFKDENKNLFSSSFYDHIDSGRYEKNKLDDLINKSNFKINFSLDSKPNFDEKSFDSESSGLSSNSSSESFD